MSEKEREDGLVEQTDYDGYKATDLNIEMAQAVVREEAVLQKFIGDPRPENEFERIHLVDGIVVRIDKIHQGKVVHSENVKEV